MGIERSEGFKEFVGLEWHDEFEGFRGDEEEEVEEEEEDEEEEDEEVVGEELG